MPIAPELRHFYGAEWRNVIRPRILSRARHRCENCGVRHGWLVDRGPYGIWRCIESPGESWRNRRGNATTFVPIPDIVRRVRIVLTVAHLNHNPADNRDQNLRALCQWCHLNHDVEQHVRSSRITRATRKDKARPLLQLAAAESEVLHV